MFWNKLLAFLIRNLSLHEETKIVGLEINAQSTWLTGGGGEGGRPLPLENWRNVPLPGSPLILIVKNRLRKLVMVLA